MFENAINDLTSLKDKKYLTFDKIEYWLLKHGTLYSQTINNYGCSKFNLPCMCWNRTKDCLFIDIFKALEKISEMYKKEKFCNNEITKYKDVKDNLEEEKKWLAKNLNEMEFDLPYSPEYGIYYDKEISLCNGKDKGHYNHYDIKIEGIDFKNSYDFQIIYNELFFTKKILPDEYNKWKIESGYVEFDD